MSKRIKSLFIIGIIILASFLRLWQLGEVPISPDWDEVALGYDAYSFIHTGRDEFGIFLPPVLRSFDDYKPALYAYLSVPAVMIFGLNTFAVRFPSAIFGIITVLSVYFLIYELFKRRDLALITSFLLAISPWHIQFSRIAFETNVGLALNVLTALFFIKGLRRPWLLSLAAICSALAIYAYQSEKVFTPLLVLLLIVIYFKDLFRVPKKYLITALIAGIITISPMFLYIVSNKGSLLRAQATLAFSDKTTFLQNNIKRLENDKKDNNILGLVLDNRRVLYLKTGLSGYLSHYDLNWLFIKGDLNRHHAPGMGLLYLWELPFVLFGIYKLFFYKDLKLVDNRSAFLIFGWFLIAPIPAAFTSGVPHAVRTLNFLPTFQVFTAIGVLYAARYVLSIKYRVLSVKIAQLFVITYSLLIILNFSYYLNQYFVQQNYFYTYDWQYGYEQLVPEVQKVKDNYSKIVVSDREPLDKSYMFFLFYLKYPPAEYQKIGQFSSGGFGNNHYFDKYEFRVIDWDNDSKERGVLFIGTPKEFPENIETVKTIYYPNGLPAIKMVEAL
jgi:4-amino-4-deoxy-L-arabinose transferase-like glycosyltransferase